MYGIYCSYGFRDSTDAALSLADHLSNSQVSDLSWFSKDHPIVGVDATWDGNIQHAKTVDCLNWISKQTHIVWFEVDAEKVKKARRLKKRNTLALLWSTIKHADIEHLSLYDNIVVPDRHVQVWLERFNAGLPIVVVPWASLAEVIRRPRLSSHCRVLMNLRANTAKLCGPLLLHAMQAVVDSTKHIDLTVVCSQSWDPSTDKAMGELQRNRPNVQHAYRPSRQARRLLAQQHEWQFWPSVIDSTGIIGLESLASGTPLIGFDVPMVSTVVRPKKSGWLVPCEIKDNSMGVPAAIPSVNHILREFKEITSSKDLLDDLRGMPWEDLDQRRLKFQDGWNAAVGL